MDNAEYCSKVADTCYGNVSIYRIKLTDEIVAIKSFNLKYVRAKRSVHGSKSVLERAMPERDLMVRLKSVGGHKIIIAFINVHYDGVKMYLEMEYCSGGDLFSYMKRERLPRDEVRSKFQEIIFSGVLPSPSNGVPAS